MRALAVHHNGNIVSGSRDDTVRLWSAEGVLLPFPHVVVVIVAFESQGQAAQSDPSQDVFGPISASHCGAVAMHRTRMWILSGPDERYCVDGCGPSSLFGTQAPMHRAVR